MSHNLIINSIGTATPRASKILSDALKIPQDYILKLLYNAPSVLFKKVDQETALKAEDTLTKLGLEVSVCKEEENIDLTTELIDISISFDNILKLPKVTEQLAVFLGCKQSEVLNLLLKEPSIVLGNVSVATAKALQKRIDANVNYSNPKKDHYTVLISNNTNDRELSNIEKLLNLKAERQENLQVIENVTYEKSQLLWRKYQSQKTIKLLNQSHQLVSITMNDFDLKNQDQVSFLINKIGMPKTILKDVYKALPITLFENINRKKSEEILNTCQQIGINTTIEKDFNFKKKLQVSNIQDSKKVIKVLAQFISKENLPKEKDIQWISKEHMPTLIAKYLFTQLEQINCNPQII